MCQFSTKVVNSYLMLVYTSDSDNDTCVLTQGDVGLMTNSRYSVHTLVCYIHARVLVSEHLSMLNTINFMVHLYIGILYYFHFTEFLLVLGMEFC